MVHRFDRVVIVDNGRVVADLPPAEVQACLDRGELGALSESGRELVAELALIEVLFLCCLPPRLDLLRFCFPMVVS